MTSVLHNTILCDQYYTGSVLYFVWSVYWLVCGRSGVQIPAGQILQSFTKLTYREPLQQVGDMLNLQNFVRFSQRVFELQISRIRANRGASTAT